MILFFIISVLFSDSLFDSETFPTYYKDNTQNQYSYEHEKNDFEICALLVP